MRLLNRRRSASAFTLLELLIVLAIIAILTAILTPVFLLARENARKVACTSNMRQIGLAMRMYVTDNDERWFPAQSVGYVAEGLSLVQPWLGYDNANITPGGDATLPANNPVRPGAIDVYVKDEGIKRCPSMPPGWQLAYTLNGWVSTDVGSFYRANPSAAMNEYGPGTKAWGYDPLTKESLYTGADDAEIQAPSETMVVWEHRNPRPICNSLQRPNWFTSPPDQAAYREHLHVLHREMMNTLWADGHVQFLRYQQLRRPYFSCRKDIYTAAGRPRPFMPL